MDYVTARIERGEATAMSNRRALLSMVSGASTLALTACSSPPNSADDYSPIVTRGAQVAQLASDNSGRVDQPIAQRRLAITHAFTLRLPGMDVEAVQQKHLAECGRLGCTVVSTEIDQSIEGRINARSSVRIAPDAYRAFSDILAAPPAKVTSHSETVDDRTIAMLDVEKRLEVKSTLRDRLAAMLREPNAKSAADLVTIEKELAQVQGDIEAITAQRDYLRTLTETVRVDITYVGLVAQVGGFDLSPINRAVNGIGGTLVQSVATLISFLAAVVPWVPLVALVGWGIRRGFRRWRARNAQA